MYSWHATTPDFSATFQKAAYRNDEPSREIGHNWQSSRPSRSYNICMDAAPVSDQVYAEATLMVAKYTELVDEAAKELSSFVRRMDCPDLHQYLSRWNWDMHNSLDASSLDMVSNNGAAYQATYITPAALSTPTPYVPSPFNVSTFPSVLGPYNVTSCLPVLPNISPTYHTVPVAITSVQGDSTKKNSTIKAPAKRRAPKKPSNEIHKCDKCPEEFDTRRKLQNHLKAHNGKMLFDCNLCIFSGCQMRALTMHKKRAHNIDVKPPRSRIREA